MIVLILISIIIFIILFISTENIIHTSSRDETYISGITKSDCCNSLVIKTNHYYSSNTIQLCCSKCKLSKGTIPFYEGYRYKPKDNRTTREINGD